MLLIETRVCMVESTGAIYVQLVCAYYPSHLHINYITYGVGTALAPRRGGHSGKRGLSDGSCLWPLLSLGRHEVPISPPKWARSTETGLAPARWAALFPQMCVLAAGAGHGQRCSMAGKAAATARCCSGMNSSAGTVALKPFISV